MMRIPIFLGVFWLALGSVSGVAEDRVSNPPTERASAEGRSGRFLLLSPQERLDHYSGLPPEERKGLFLAMEEADRVEFFDGLSEEERLALFRALDEGQRKTLFLRLSEETKDEIFTALGDQERGDLLARLGPEEKARLHLRFPWLELLVPDRSREPGPSRKGPQVKEKPEAASRIEKVMSGEFPMGIARELRQYGYDFFREDASAFLPVSNIPVGPDYIVGPGDQLLIHLWGKVEKTYDATVSRDGGVFIPRLGDLPVNGLTFAELKPFLARKFREYYTDFELTVTLGRLRSIRVFVVGEANRPGTHTISSLSTAVAAVYAARGPNKNGSLRNIRVLRDDRVLARLDLYDFFLQGTKPGDVRLQTGDVIVIPVIGPAVGVAGNVRRPAIYELKGPETLSEVLGMAGGVLPVGHLQNVIVERVQGNQRRVILSLNLDPSSSKSSEQFKIGLLDGDIVRVYPVHKGLRQTVYLEGHVKYPREYEFHSGMRLRDILPSYEAVLPEPYLARGDIVRLVPPDLHPQLLEFHLGRLLAGDESENLALQDLDRVRVYAVWEKGDFPKTTIQGAVRRPGSYRLYRGMRVKDLIFQAGNISSRAYPGKSTLSRVVPGKERTDMVTLEFSLKEAMEGAPEHNLLLSPDDTVHIREIPQYGQSLLRKVYLEGEFRFPGEYTFSEGERLSSVIQRAGGLTEEAYPFGSMLFRESVKEVQRARLADYIRKLEEDTLTLSSQAAETALDKEEAGILQETLTAKRQLLEKLKTAQPTGRMVIDLREVLTLPDSYYNFELRPGDRLVVEKRPDHVNVLGEVFNPTAIFAEKGKSAGYYLEKVGGVTGNADNGQTYLVKANGTVISRSQEGFFGIASWDAEKDRWSAGGFDSVSIDPGDTIIVPRKVERYPWLRITKDITQILYQIAVAAGVIIVAY
jgi:protein involved in polysaccharide export with SLBB domain